MTNTREDLTDTELRDVGGQVKRKVMKIEAWRSPGVTGQQHLPRC
jgi:hypothetical protein